MYVGEGLRGSNGARSTLHRIAVTPSATHNQTGPLWCWFPSGWACAHPTPLWVSPTTSPVSLGVSPAAAPTPTWVFKQRFAWVARSASLPAICPVYLCTNVGPQGLLVVRLHALFISHSSSLNPTTATPVLSHPAAPLCPSYRSRCMFIFYFLGVGLPRHSIFCQFWLCEDAQCIYLHRHLGSPGQTFLINCKPS